MSPVWTISHLDIVLDKEAAEKLRTYGPPERGVSFPASSFTGWSTSFARPAGPVHVKDPRDVFSRVFCVWSAVV